MVVVMVIGKVTVRVISGLHPESQLPKHGQNMVMWVLKIFVSASGIKIK